jgi:hypothetical protein
MADDDLIPDTIFPEEEPETPETPIEAAVEAPVEAAPEPAKAETHVPLAALQEARAENRTLKERLNELDQIKAMLAAQNAPKMPDVFENPEGFAGAMLQRVQQVEANTIAEISERMARSSAGDQVVDAALDAAQAAGVVDQFRGRKDPWGDLVKWHKSQRALAEIGDDPAAYAERVREQIRQEFAAQRQSGPIPAAPSLAGQPNLGARAAPAWTGPTPLDDILGR